MKSYLDIVNEAIAEAKVTLDPLTSANFADPPRTLLYNRFKTWVNRAYKELFMRRKEWNFRMERGNLTIYPRLHLTDLASPLVIGDVIEGASSGVQATVVKLHYFESVEGGGDEVTVSLDFDDDVSLFDFYITESIDRVTPNPELNIAKVKGIGTYKISDEVANMKDIDPNTITIYDPENPEQMQYPAIRSLNWDQWISSDYAMAPFGGRPEIVSKAPNGTLEFYPRLDRAYIMNFNYSRGLPEMVEWNDTPIQIPEEYEDYILWKAIADYADWDSNQRVFARANKNLENYIYWLERDELEDPRFGPNLFYRR